MIWITSWNDSGMIHSKLIPFRQKLAEDEPESAPNAFLQFRGIQFRIEGLVKNNLLH